MAVGAEAAAQVGFHRHNMSGPGERSRWGGCGGGDVEGWGRAEGSSGQEAVARKKRKGQTR